MNIRVRLTGYRADCVVTDVVRQRNGNNNVLLTVAEGYWDSPHVKKGAGIGDWVTRMRLADFLESKGLSKLPRNPDKAYCVPKYAKERGDTGEIKETACS